MLSTILLIFFIPICVLLILIVLLQAGKGGGLAGAFGGTGGQAILGTRGTADFLGKLTIYLAIGFMVLSLVLSFSYGKPKSINIQEESAAVESESGTQAEAPDATAAGQDQAPAADEESKTPPSEGNN